MLIRELSQEECFRVLRRNRLVRLACAHENQPYLVPVYLGLHESTHSLYGFTTLGQKIEWMRGNPRVCVEADEINGVYDWTSVIITGRFEELGEIPEPNDASQRRPERSVSGAGVQIREQDSHPVNMSDERQRAWQILQAHPEWWEPGCSVWKSRHGQVDKSHLTPIFYRVVIESMTGHQATDGQTTP
ncbi:pyridoxamine 5'-phosphate oxidase family protein [Schlesneria sp. T3-172]|uniref:pyridoxamine 5'-phosphate oxidase family protein n=1 Tax=Schlesneria sphaerica TaxID=3373610 RepID=UPI0037CAAE76